MRHFELFLEGFGGARIETGPLQRTGNAPWMSQERNLVPSLPIAVMAPVQRLILSPAAAKPSPEEFATHWKRASL